MANLIEAQSYIAEDNPQAARRIAQRVWSGGKQLAVNPYIGRPGRRPDTREWVIQHTPSLLVYRVKTDTVETVRVWHAHRDSTSET